METMDEIPVEDHRYFHLRLTHLESRQPAVLLHYLENGTLTMRLRGTVMRAMKAKSRLVIDEGMTELQADEWVIQQVLADPREPEIQLLSAMNRSKLWAMMFAYRAALPLLPRTYLSQIETTG